MRRASSDSKKKDFDPLPEVTGRVVMVDSTVELAPLRGDVPVNLRAEFELAAPGRETTGEPGGASLSQKDNARAILTSLMFMALAKRFPPDMKAWLATEGYELRAGVNHDPDEVLEFFIEEMAKRL